MGSSVDRFTELLLIEQMKTKVQLPYVLLHMSFTTRSHVRNSFPNILKHLVSKLLFQMMCQHPNIFPRPRQHFRCPFDAQCPRIHRHNELRHGCLQRLQQRRARSGIWRVPWRVPKGRGSRNVEPGVPSREVGEMEDGETWSQVMPF